MQRPRRQAASEAMDKIQRIREWEELPETSKRFRDCAKQIEQEFRSEVKQREVRSEDLDLDSHTEESEDEYETADVSFVSDDCASADGEYVPPEDEEEVQEALDDIDASDGASEQESVPEQSQEVESDAASLASTEIYAETVSGDASSDASLAATQVQ